MTSVDASIWMVIAFVAIAITLLWDKICEEVDNLIASIYANNPTAFVIVVVLLFFLFVILFLYFWDKITSSDFVTFGNKTG